MTENETLLYLVKYMLRYGQFTIFDFYCVTDKLEELGIDWEDFEPRTKRARCCDCRWAREAPKVDGYHLECFLRPLSRHYTKDDDFCSYFEEAADD